MLLTLRCVGDGAGDFSWLLCKRPDRFQTFKLGFGKAHVFFTENSPERSTANLLIEIDSDWINGHFYGKSSEVKYVSDRPFISSSLLSSAISQVFGSALKGVCAARPEAVDKKLNLEARIENFPCRLAGDWIGKIFDPLGFRHEYNTQGMDCRFPEWGLAPQGRLSLSVESSLKNLLSQIFVLLPIFDRQTHVWPGETELASFTRLASPWLLNHPHADFIIDEYFRRGRELGERARQAILGVEKPQAGEHGPGLNTRRHEAVSEALLGKGVKSVIDLGCGDGKLLARLYDEHAFEDLAGMDVSAVNVAFAKNRLQKRIGTGGKMPQIFEGSLTYRDKSVRSRPFKRASPQACDEYGRIRPCPVRARQPR